MSERSRMILQVFLVPWLQRSSYVIRPYKETYFPCHLFFLFLEVSRTRASWFLSVDISWLYLWYKSLCLSFATCFDLFAFITEELESSGWFAHLERNRMGHMEEALANRKRKQTSGSMGKSLEKWVISLWGCCSPASTSEGFLWEGIFARCASAARFVLPPLGLFVLNWSLELPWPGLWWDLNSSWGLSAVLY